MILRIPCSLTGSPRPGSPPRSRSWTTAKRMRRAEMRHRDIGKQQPIPPPAQCNGCPRSPGHRGRTPAGSLTTSNLHDSRSQPVSESLSTTTDENLPHTAVITGAASGMGKATTELFLSRGWTVIALDLSEVSAAATAGTLLPAQVDITDRTAVNAVLREAV